MKGGYFVRTYELWRNGETRGPAGNLIHDWAKQADVLGRAYVGKAMQSTFDQGQIPAGIVNWTFACGGNEDVRKADQVRFDGRTLEVKAVSVTSAGDRLQCLCEEVQV